MRNRYDTMLLAVNDVERKKAVASHSMLVRYGTSCFLQLLDDEPAPSENRTKQIREERIARAVAQKSKFQQELCRNIKVVNHDHNYCSRDIRPSYHEVESEPASDQLIRDLYKEHICISPTNAVELEIATRNQSLSNLWHNEWKFCITTSIMKEVCHRKPSTSVKVFIENKLSPDGIVEVGEDKGCLEVKCPFVCTKKSITEASIESSSFCLHNSNARLHLKKSPVLLSSANAALCYSTTMV